MIIELGELKNKKIGNVLDKSMKELGKFYNINWINNKPKLFIAPNRKIVSNLFEREVPPWSTGWKWNSNIVVLDYEVLKKEIENYTTEKYSKLIKHELSHCFYGVLSKNVTGPKWLWEGVALYTAEQNKPASKFNKFEHFLKFYNKHKIENISVYFESGAVIEILIDKFGKTKLLKLIKTIEPNQSKKVFDENFNKIYGFKPNYKDFNNLLKN